MATGPITGSTSAVQQKRRELRDCETDYRLINDCVAGQRAVKKRGTVYLPAPNPDDESDENVARYDAYRTRAVFYSVTQRTLSGLVGEVFARDPVEEVPTSLDIVSEDADGSGLTLTQLAKRACRYTLSAGRAGVLADYPAVEDGVTKADVESGDVQPTLTIYDALSIINWRTKKYKAKTYLTLVVLEEKYDDEDDGFSVTKKVQYRVLRLVEGVYTVEVWRDGAVHIEQNVPQDAQGNPFNEIPFTFIGSENNDAEIDLPPMLALADINVAHYRNSADYEEGVYMTGQPTPVFAGLTEDWVKNVMDGQVRLGSRGGVMLPQGGSADLLQMEANTAASEAMDKKERQMVALGAKLVEQKEVQRTATEANIENNGETSVLADVAKNVSAAIKFGLEMCARFSGDEGAEIVYELNTDYSIARMSSQERMQTMSEWQSGLLTFSEARAALRKAGVATLDDEEAKDEIEADDFTVNPNDLIKKAEDDPEDDDNTDEDDPEDNPDK
jgi:hypothetical protein